ncbi:MAG: glutathione-disulfide reductase [Myxococcales bacterium]|nr:glutathione-disulfide reductase [Myxococcales bacterium]
MQNFDYDLFVIGAGSGGVRASRVAAQLGARVAVCEEGALGGTCVNVGCVPKKLLVYGSQYSSDFADAAGFGWDVSAEGFSWKRLIHNKNKEVDRLNSIYGNILEKAGVTLIRGKGRLIDPHTVEVAGERYTCGAILIVTGGWPFVPHIPGREYGITSNEAFYLDDLPRRTVVVGGGYIGVEFSSILRGFGSEVTLVHRGDLVLSGFDHDIRTFLVDEMSKRGVHFRFNTQLSRIEKRDDESLLCHVSDGSTIEADCVLFATGRTPRIEGLGLKEVGVEVNAWDHIVVDRQFRTNIPSIYALGDVTGGLTLTPVALAEGMILARNLFGGQSAEMDYDNIPTAVFSQPNVGTVGLPECEAREQCASITIYRTSFRAMKHTLSGRDERTMMKLIVDDATDRVLGCHMVGPDAGEIVQGLGIALKCGATKAQFDATIGIHPTAAEEFVTMRTPLSH